MAVKRAIARVISIEGILAGELKAPCDRLASLFFNPSATETKVCCCCWLYECRLDIWEWLRLIW